MCSARLGPHWSRIGVSYSGPLQVSAFKAHTGVAVAMVTVYRGRSVTQTGVVKGVVVNTGTLG